MFQFSILQYLVLLIVPILFIPSYTIKCQDFDFKGQISSWGTWTRLTNSKNIRAGVRYIPQFNFNYSLNGNNLLNTEILFNTYYLTDFTTNDYSFKFYRAILRYTTDQTETQAGLQKINFGPAQLLRPLMWFDRIDPRDPLKLTEGVYALRFKYNFLNNSMIWLWCLYGNKNTIGYELFPTEDNTPEFGGRVQVPLLEGEIAGTIHTRKVNAGLFNYRENHYALDGRWDVGTGLWFETALQQNNSSLLFYKWIRMTTIGADYTIPEGNGIYVLGEHMVSAFSKEILSTDRNFNISALMITYILNVLDKITLQEYYDWTNKNIYQYFQFQRTYDNFIINVALFHYPENGESILFTGTTFPMSGYGLELMLIYSY